MMEIKKQKRWSVTKDYDYVILNHILTLAPTSKLNNKYFISVMEDENEGVGEREEKGEGGRGESRRESSIATQSTSKTNNRNSHLHFLFDFNYQNANARHNISELWTLTNKKEIKSELVRFNFV